MGVRAGADHHGEGRWVARPLGIDPVAELEKAGGGPSDAGRRWVRALQG